jgi:RecB family exonuclease
LYLSYPGLDAKAQPLTPSPFVAELERAFGETPLSRRIDQELSPVPREGDILCPRDLRLRAVYDAVHGNAQRLASLVKIGATETASTASPLVVDNLLASLKTIHARSRGEGFGTYEGVFASAELAATLAERFGPRRCWSPSQLETYAHCPFRFFAERVLKLEPLGDLAFQINHALRGELLHGTLANYHRALNAEHRRPSSPSKQSALEFERAAATVLATLLEGLASDEPVQQALREVDRRLLSQWLANYYVQHQKYDELWTENDEPLRPAHFEISFGPATDFLVEEESVQVAGDQLATTAPLELRRDGESLFFRGRVDRVDLGKVAGQEVFNVVDYKSGSKYRLTPESISAGETLQLPLYALAIEQLLLADRGVVAWQASYWQVKEKGFNHRNALKFRQTIEGVVEVDPEWLELQEALLDRVFALVRGIRQGQFPMHCADEDCTGHCEFRTVCRVAQVRSLEKTWQPPGKTP